jgi:DNA-binding transcriptional LysR family regulator
MHRLAQQATTLETGLMQLNEWFNFSLPAACSPPPTVIDQDSLAALDGLLWLRSGEVVAQRLGLSQSTVSRQARRCLDLFEINVAKLDGEWDLIGDAPLLTAERQVHQQARWRGKRPLRLEATYWSGPLLCDPVPQGWMLGLCNIVGIQRNFELLRERVVDVWLAGLPDLPAPNDPELTSLTLCQLPVHCVVSSGHPLLQRPTISFDDLEHYPSLGLPEGAYPEVEAALRRLGLWSSPVRMRRYQRQLWEGKTEQELTIGYGTAMSLDLGGPSMQPLPLTLPFQSGEALVVRREFSDTLPFRQLAQTVHGRLSQLALRLPEIQMLPLPFSGSSGTAVAPPRPGP